MTAARRHLITAMKAALCLLVLGFVTAALVKQFRAVRWSEVRFALWPSVGAVGALLGVSLMQLAARWTLLAAYGYRLNWRVQVGAAWVPQLGKYLPGGVASIAGVVWVLRKRGVPGAVGLSVAVLLDGMAVTAGFIVSTPLLLWGPVWRAMPWGWAVCGALVILGLVMLHPRVFVGAMNWMLRRMGRQAMGEAPAAKRYVWPVLASFGQWLCAGVALWLMTLSVVSVEAKLIALFVATAALAMTISYLTPFAPGGIGVREGIYLLTLSPMLGAERAPAVAIVAVAMRVVQTVMEVLLAGVGVWALRSEEPEAVTASAR